MKYFILSLSLFLVSCEKVKETIKVTKIPPTKVKVQLFTSTQQYEIFCWTIKKHEGFSQKVYRCSANKKTVGWGFTNIKSVKNIHDADLIFQKIVVNLFRQVSKEYPNLSYLQKAAIVSLYYNTGDLNKIKNSGFSRKLQKRQLSQAIIRFKQWCKCTVNKKTITIKGLQNRRGFESKLLDNSFTMKDYVTLRKEIIEIYKQNRS